MASQSHYPRTRRVTVPEMFQQPKTHQRQWNSKRMGLLRVPVANPFKPSVAPVLNLFYIRCWTLLLVTDPLLLLMLQKFSLIGLICPKFT